VSFMITCPICGRRNIQEFRFGGENRGPKPFDNKTTTDQWYSYIHLRTNMAGPQQEWWFHKDGCGTWFAIWRDLATDLEFQTKENGK